MLKNEIVGTICVVNNGNQSNIKIDASFDSCAFLQIISGGQVVCKCSNETKFIISCRLDIKKIGIVFLGQFGIVAFAGNDDFDECKNLLLFQQDDEEIEKEIDKAMSSSHPYLLSVFHKAKKGAYFRKKRSLLVELFSNAEKDVGLEMAFENSKWVKFRIDGDDLVAGIIYKNNKPAIICFGFKDKTQNKKVLKTTHNRYFFVSCGKNSGYYINMRNADDGKECF
ncbi:MAG: hypothetical protein IJS68_02970 [Clostridia bacterium]|nr:hypothetical protein [Clostridia bacterium]